MGSGNLVRKARMNRAQRREAKVAAA